MGDLDVIFLSETWLSHAEASLIGDVLCSYGVNDVQIFQNFAMDVPPGYGEGRRHGGVAMICRRDRFTFSRLQSEEQRLLGIKLSRCGTPSLNIVGCYMPYFCGTTEQLESYRDACASLEALMCLQACRSSYAGRRP